MLDILWAVMLLTGILYGALTGNMNQVTDAALSLRKRQCPFVLLWQELWLCG